MLFPNLAMAQQLEYHESWSSSEHARLQAALHPGTRAVSQLVGSAQMVYCGRKSPLSQVYAWGLSGGVSSDELDAMERFYLERRMGVRLRVCPYADPSVLHILGARGYVLRSLMHVFAYPLKNLTSRAPGMRGLEIKMVNEREARRWFEMIGAGGDWAEPDGASFMTIRCVSKPGSRFYLAYMNGQPVSGGALEIYQGVASLVASDTLPEYRRHGVNTALLRARLEIAAQAGCEIAVLKTHPGSATQTNALREGFELVYTTMSMHSPE